ncbi:D-2-hydroxyacid dehydrogenase [Sphingomonas corticis]|uniref:D-2-hydroxyacid dehydrogenase n=1 Tax=Sphingomonas corticis TaxID=2722791 RepID=A0ABX1CQ17_9SPHN|nr:D-2-hydroxyacid dehydrogenase [Sphingomonas corticis]NJR80037.1 D-2-hydroxyacid dehydrogenase [Sphingomonas corticis]
MARAVVLDPRSRHALFAGLPVRTLLSAAALDRLAGRADRLAGLDLLILDHGGVVRDPLGGVVDDPDPEICWLSLDVYEAGLLPVMLGVLMDGRSGRWAQSFSAGLDSPVFRRLMEKGYRLTRSDAQAPAIADYVMAQVMALLHPFSEQADARAEREWRRVPFREVGETRWLVVGLGAIGGALASRLRPFGAQVTAARRTPGPDPRVDAVTSPDRISAVLPETDVVVLACPLSDRTRGLADDAFFQAMRPGAILVNVARGGVVDEDALRRGLGRGQPAWAVLDVVSEEPLPADSWIWSHPRVRLTAHTSAAGGGVQRRGDALFLDNLARFLAGEPLRNEADPAEVGL